jgi:hypothetical protein
MLETYTGLEAYDGQTIGEGNNLVSNDKQKVKVLNEFFHSCFNTALPPLIQEEDSEPAPCPDDEVLDPGSTTTLRYIQIKWP